MFERAMIIVLAIFFLAFIVLVDIACKRHKEKQLFGRVSWCVTDDSNTRCNMSLLDWLNRVPHYSKKKSPDCFFPNADKLFVIDEKYWLQSEEEFATAREILCVYQKELSQKYFSGHLSAGGSMSKLTNEEYFLVTLKDFLEKYECKKVFWDHDMYTTKEYKSYGSWGGPLFDATYVLSDFAVVYHKMYLITQIYCLTLRKNASNTNALSFERTEATKKVLDTREMKVSRY